MDFAIHPVSKDYEIPIVSKYISPENMSIYFPMSPKVISLTNIDHFCWSFIALYLWGDSHVHKKRFIANLHRVIDETIQEVVILILYGLPYWLACEVGEALVVLFFYEI